MLKSNSILTDCSKGHLDFFIQQTEGGYWGYTINFLRPELVIDRSSPVKQNIGDFVDEEEKILALFKVLKHIHHGYFIS